MKKKQQMSRFFGETLKLMSVDSCYVFCVKYLASKDDFPVSLLHFLENLNLLKFVNPPPPPPPLILTF